MYFVSPKAKKEKGLSNAANSDHAPCASVIGVGSIRIQVDVIDEDPKTRLKDGGKRIGTTFEFRTRSILESNPRKGVHVERGCVMHQRDEIPGMSKLHKFRCDAIRIKLKLVERQALVKRYGLRATTLSRRSNVITGNNFPARRGRQWLKTVSVIYSDYA